ncbi:hypothetical protein EG329_013623 [Mollisiaceae sp. DMI_Dod_QoI]|nr:hypothetical protein EG329_013623 [Helotiales sp. DMI_Dod_QoI]
MGVDYTTVLNPNGGLGRDSVRITSNKAWIHGLVILDLAHMPSTDCGSWPAFWMMGPNWPAGGEIDIIEGVNSNTVNQISLHTNDNCTIAGTSELGTMINPICQESQSTGCAVLTNTPNSYGTPFNTNNGGVYAMEWTSSYIRVWYFPHNAIPSDISFGNPNPANWGLPQANMQGNCNIDQHFYQHQIVFDTTFCGDWAGNAWAYDSVCSLKAPNCQTYVAENPAAFADAYWMINYLKVYTSVAALQFQESYYIFIVSASFLKALITLVSLQQQGIQHFFFISPIFINSLVLVKHQYSDILQNILFYPSSIIVINQVFFHSTFDPNYQRLLACVQTKAVVEHRGHICKI